MEDTFRIREYIRGYHPKSAVLAGGGFRFYDAVMNDRALTERSTACGMDL